MKAFIASLIAVAIVSVGAYYVLKGYGQGSDSAYTTTSARPK